MAKSTEKSLKIKNASAEGGKRRSRLWRAFLALLLLSIPVLLLLVIVFGSKRLFFVGNDRLVLRHVSVQRGRFWRGREKALIRRIGLEPGSNLFALDCRGLRRKLAAIPSIESAEVVPVLPDTLELRLTERIPRAVIGNPNSPWVVDEHNVVMPRAESLAVENLQLPVISGVPFHEVRSGAELKRLAPAMELVMAAVRAFPEIRILSISAEREDRLFFFMRYRGGRLLTVTMPTSGGRGVNFLLSALQSAILDARSHGDMRTNFDLSYEGRVILK